MSRKTLEAAIASTFFSGTRLEISQRIDDRIQALSNILWELRKLADRKEGA